MCPLFRFAVFYSFVYKLNIDYVVNSWEKDVVGMVEEKHGKNKISISFECETLKADKAAEEHIRQFMPKLAGLDAVGKYATCFPFIMLFKMRSSYFTA